MLPTGPAAAADYVIDTAKSHASINFRIKHLGFSWLTGRFDDFSGTFAFDEAQARGLEGEGRDQHRQRQLQPRRARQAPAQQGLPRHRKLPQGDLREHRASSSTANKATITGNLTLHGVTKQIAIAAERVGGGSGPVGRLPRGVHRNDAPPAQGLRHQLRPRAGVQGGRADPQHRGRPPIARSARAARCSTACRTDQIRLTSPSFRRAGARSVALWHKGISNPAVAACARIARCSKRGPATLGSDNGTGRPSPRSTLPVVSHALEKSSPRAGAEQQRGRNPPSRRLAQDLRDYDISGEQSIALAQGAIACFVLALHAFARFKSGLPVFDSLGGGGARAAHRELGLRWWLASRQDAARARARCAERRRRRPSFCR